MSRKGVTGVVAALLLTVAAAMGWYRLTGRPPEPMPAASSTNPALADAEREAGALVGKPRTYRRQREDGRDLHALVLRGDFAAAAKLMQERQAGSTLRYGSFTPFNRLMSDTPLDSEPALLEQLDRWVRQEPGSAEARLLRAIYHDRTGWTTRGPNLIRAVRPENVRAFRAHTEAGTADIVEAIRLNPANPYNTFILMNLLQRSGDSARIEAAFQNAVSMFPEYTSLHSSRLIALQPRWGGSLERMEEFVDRYASGSPKGSPLKMLYLDLYASLVSETARSYCDDQSGEQRAQCLESMLARTIRPELRERVYEVLKWYGDYDRAAYVDSVGTFLARLIRMRGAERHAAGFLQITASIMGSDNQLSAADTSKNHYMIDRLTGLTWFLADHHDNAEAQYRRAFADLEHETFPDEEARDRVLLQLYGELAGLYANTRQYPKALVYATAAAAIDPGSPSTQKCEILYRMKLYDEAVDACTTLIGAGAGLNARIWRGMSYRKAGQLGPALEDLRAVADSENQYRDSAAIEVSYVLALRKDMKGELAALESYGFLFDPSIVDKKTVAIAFNNRCYAKKELGLLQDALDDCTQSLRYDTIPDAVNKQQQLIRLLQGKQEGGL